MSVRLKSPEAAEDVAMRYLKTREVEELFGVAPWIIRGLIHNRKIPRPAYDASLDLVWSPKDIENVRRALEKARAKAAKRSRPKVAG
jgi:hypothetical protein